MTFIENIYNKECLKCGQIYIGFNSDLFGICSQCVKDNHTDLYYCDRCDSEITYNEYCTNNGLCNLCASELY